VPYVRCSHCEARRTLARKLADYVRVPRCRRCGRNRYRVDRWRHKHERGKKPTCTRWDCLYGFPHRRGSRLCLHNPKLTDKEIAELFGGR
jgi:hypothetical protein